MKERKIITKMITLHEMKVHIKNNGWVDILDFWEIFFNAGSW